MYIHTQLGNGERLFAFPVSVSFDIKDDCCDAEFSVLCNRDDEESREKIQSEIKERIGLSDKVTKDVAIACCNGNKEYETFIEDLWHYVSMSYGDSIPYGQFFEEIYSIARFVSAWQPKTGRQSEMRMLYNFMSAFGEEVAVPENWQHLECYLTPNLWDVQNNQFDEFFEFKILDSAIRKTYEHEYTNTVIIDSVSFKAMAIPDISEFRSVLKSQTTSIFQRLISVLTVVPVNCLLFLTMQSTGNGISKIENPRYGVRWSTHSESSNVSLDIRKRCTKV